MGVCPFVGVSRDPKCLACQGQLQCLAGLGSSDSGNVAEMRCLFSQSGGKTCSSTQTRPSITMLVLKQRCKYPDRFDHGCVVDVCIADLKSAWQTFPFGFSTFHNTTNGVISHGQELFLMDKFQWTVLMSLILSTELLSTLTSPVRPRMTW